MSEYWDGIDVSRIPLEVLKTVEDLAARHNLADNLMRCCDYLRSIGKKRPVMLFKDFAPYSFLFDAGFIYGGMIYHGPGDTGVEFPTLSVRLGPDLSEGWSLHT